MSELVVGSLKGLSANNFVIDVASGSKIVQPGAILQVVSMNTGSATITTSTSFQNTSATATITPSATSSKIIVLFDSEFNQQNNSSGSTFLQLFRGTVSGTALASTTQLYFGTSINAIVPVSLNFVDSPNTTSATTYTIGIRSANAANTAQVGGNSNLILMEVAG